MGRYFIIKFPSPLVMQSFISRWAIPSSTSRTVFSWTNKREALNKSSMAGQYFQYISFLDQHFSINVVIKIYRYKDQFKTYQYQGRKLWRLSYFVWSEKTHVWLILSMVFSLCLPPVFISSPALLPPKQTRTSRLQKLNHSFKMISNKMFLYF